MRRSRRPRRLVDLLGAIGLLGLGAAFVLVAGTGARADVGDRGAPALSVEVTKLHTNAAEVRAVCPVDPPATLFLVGVLPGGTEPELLGSMPVTCTRAVQRFVLPLSVTLEQGTRVTDVTVTVSSDGGEINGFADTIRVRSALRLPEARLVDGRLVQGGDAGLVRMVLNCPRGTEWSVTGQTWAFAEIGDDDTLASTVPASGECTGRNQTVRFRIEATFNAPIPANCSAEFSVTVAFTGRTETVVILERGGAGPATNGQVCFR